MPGRLRRRHAVVGLLLLALTGCTSGGPAPEPGPGRPRLSGCDRVAFADVRGRAPAYLRGGLSRFRNDDALCAGRWVPRLADGFVPQGVAVRGRTTWLSGMDGNGGKGRKYCHVMRLDRSGRLEAEIVPLRAVDQAGTELRCRHGGGLALDEHGLWLTERVGLWLLDPETLEVRRTWALQGRVRGSFGVLDDQGRLGLGRFQRSGARRGAATLHWFDVGTVLRAGTTSLGPDDAVAVRRLPRQTQGAVWARLAGREGLWLASSTTRCGVLTGPGGRRWAFVPGAEGMAVVDDRLWVVSESTAQPYFEEGGRPVVPSLSGLDVQRLSRWLPPDCTP